MLVATTVRPAAKILIWLSGRVVKTQLQIASANFAATNGYLICSKIGLLLSILAAQDSFKLAPLITGDTCNHGSKFKRILRSQNVFSH